MDELAAEDRKTKRERLAKWAGMAVMAFCVVGFGGSVAFAFLIDAFTLDIGAIVYFLVGLRTMKGGALPPNGHWVFRPSTFSPGSPFLSFSRSMPTG